MITLEQLLEYSKGHPTGFTIDGEGKPIIKGFAVAINRTKNMFGEYGAKQVIDIALKDSYYIGAWKESHSTILWYDAVLVFGDYDIAASIARREQQKSFYDLENNILCTFENKVI